MVLAINNRGYFRFMILDGTVTASVFRDFLKRRIEGMDRKIYLVVDQRPTHKTKLVRTFIEANKDRSELLILPPCSPALNPDELVWPHVEQQVGKRAAHTKDELVHSVIAALLALQKLSGTAADFFRTPVCACAAI